MLSYVNIANSEPKHKSAGLGLRNKELDSGAHLSAAAGDQVKMCAPAAIEAQKSKFQ